MVKAYSLNKGHVDWLESEGKKSDRGASGELRKILDEERVRRTTGVAEGRLDSTLEISRVAVPVRLTDEATAKLETEVEKTLEPAKEAIRDGLDDVVTLGLAKVEFNKVKLTEEKPLAGRPWKPMMKGDLKEKMVGKFSGVSELAKKIAKDIPGVAVASEVSGLPLPVKFNKIMADEPRDGSLDQEGITDKMRKSAKKRPVETEGRVELVKGFWRETFDSVGDAMVEVAQKGWKEGEYTIKPLK